ncbi:MAG: NAD(P)-dependent oxidoreductase, partial [Methylococcales bacterium]|nr:NAD(P)-dependent oxidoreductase [Methylococcales bacterium]
MSEGAIAQNSIADVVNTSEIIILCLADSQTVSGAEQGSLTIMAGGALDDIKVAQNILEPLYKQFTHIGEIGCGQITKICNQMIVSTNVLVIAEIIALAQKWLGKTQ